MKCLKCKNTREFIILGNQNLRVDFRDGHLKMVRKEDFDICDIYPVTCGQCQSEDVDFKYTEIEKIFKIAK